MNSLMNPYLRLEPFEVVAPLLALTPMLTPRWVRFCKFQLIRICNVAVVKIVGIRLLKAFPPVARTVGTDSLAL